MEKYLQIGEIVNTHGVKGELKVIPLTDDPARFNELKWVYLDKLNAMTKVEIDYVKFFKAFVILKLKGINDLNSAESLKSLFLLIDRENAVELPEDSFFICDLIGCEVYEDNGLKLGIINEVLKTGSNDVFVVKAEGKKDVLVPALKSVVSEVFIENKKIVVSLPEGLI